MMAWLCYLLCYPGMAALALAMERHQRQVFPRPPPRWATLGLRSAGSLGLVAAAAAGVSADDWLIGLAHWCGGLSLAALLVGLLLPYRPQWLLPGAGLALILAVAGSV